MYQQCYQDVVVYHNEKMKSTILRRSANPSVLPNVSYIEAH